MKSFVCFALAALITSCGGGVVQKNTQQNSESNYTTEAVYHESKDAKGIKKIHQSGVESLKSNNEFESFDIKDFFGKNLESKLLISQNNLHWLFQKTISGQNYYYYYENTPGFKYNGIIESSSDQKSTLVFRGQTDYIGRLEYSGDDKFKYHSSSLKVDQRYSFIDGGDYDDNSIFVLWRDFENRHFLSIYNKERISEKRKQVIFDLLPNLTIQNITKTEGSLFRIKLVDKVSDSTRYIRYDIDKEIFIPFI